MDDICVDRMGLPSPIFLTSIRLKTSTNYLAQVASWALIISLSAQLACGEKDAVIFLNEAVQGGDDVTVHDLGQSTAEVTGEFAGVGSKEEPQPGSGNAFKSGMLRMVSLLQMQYKTYNL